MTTISNLNAIVQHGDSALETQNVKNQTIESSHVAATVKEKEEEQNKAVQESDNSEQIKTDQESAGTKERRKRKKKKKADTETESEQDEENPDKTGGLVDTVA